MKANPAEATDAIMAAYAARTAECAAHPERLVSLGAQLGRIAAAKGGEIAVTFEDETITWGDLHRRSNRLARALTAKGVKAGDLITIALPNGIGFIEICYGLWKAGATPQPVSSRLPEAELKAIADLAGGPIIIGAPYDTGRPSVQLLPP